MEQLLDEIVGNRIHKQVLARAEPLLYILASAGVLKGIEMQKMWERAVSLHSATDETTSDLAVSIMELIRSTIEFVSPAMLVLLLRMVSKTAFPDGGHQTPHSGSTPGYATAVEFIKMLHGTPALLIISKGEAPAKNLSHLYTIC